jgi:hypothetical protein
MFKQNKTILMGLLTLAICATQAQAGFLNFDGELTTRLLDVKVATAKPGTSLLSQLKLSGSKRLPDGFKVNYEIRTGESNTNAFVGTGTTSQTGLQLSNLDISYSPNSATTITFGRQSTPLTTYSEVMFDNDLYVDALAASYKTTLTPQASFQINGAYIMPKADLRSTGTTKSNYQETRLALQPEVNVKASESLNVGGYVALIQSSHVNGTAGFKNTVFGLKGTMSTPGVNNVSLYTELNSNSTSNVDDDKSTVYGIGIGDKTVSGLGSWNAQIESR